MSPKEAGEMVAGRSFQEIVSRMAMLGEVGIGLRVRVRVGYT